MPSALEEFRAQREAADAVLARLGEVTRMLDDLRAQANALVQDKALRDFLQAEREWLSQTTRTLADVRTFREDEMRRFWPAMWRRWVVAVVFALASAFAFGSGYVFASRPYETELAQLRSRVEVMDYVAARVLPDDDDEASGI
jgi:hypothetical protein